LAKLGIITSTGAENLKKAISEVLSLRLQVHFFYKNEKEFLLHPEEGKQNDPQFYYFNPKNIQVLTEIYRILLPFHKVATAFYQNIDKSVFDKQDF
jgi:hypothetical protein